MNVRFETSTRVIGYSVSPALGAINNWRHVTALYSKARSAVCCSAVRADYIRPLQAGVTAAYFILLISRI